jgi:cyclopropane-fatty-acyl-phospholipid synthase
MKTLADTVTSPVTGIPAKSDISKFQTIARRLLLSRMAGLQHGRIIFEDAHGRHEFGMLTERCSLTAHINVHDPEFYTDVVFGGTIGAGETFMKAYWRCDRLTDLVRILVVNRELMNDMEKGLACLMAPLSRGLHWLRKNSVGGSRRNIEAHYDLGNDFFELFLDETWMYSAAIFPDADTDLHRASVHKLDVICKKLELKPEDHLLEIGTGWGGLAIHAARNYGCRVTTTTISQQQHEMAQQRIRAAGLEGRITLLKDDYRKLEGRYDKLVSVEMIEAVGHQYFGKFFEICNSLLKPEGLMLLQAITIADRYYEQAKRSVDFIQRYIFPGGCLPSVSVINDCVARRTDLRLLHMHDFAEHYARTLQLWRDRFHKNLDKIKLLGYPDTFIRMWEYYLCYCEGGFMERSTGVVQMLFAKPDNRRAAIL